jgi:hypothetical protein
MPDAGASRKRQIQGRRIPGHLNTRSEQNRWFECLKLERRGRYRRLVICASYMCVADRPGCDFDSATLRIFRDADTLCRFELCALKFRSQWIAWFDSEDVTESDSIHAAR